MLRSQLVDKLAQNFNQKSMHEIGEYVRIIVTTLADALSQEQRIELRGFGTFSLHYHPPRNAHNPKTGKRLVTPAKYLPHFKPGKILRRRVNGQ